MGELCMVIGKSGSGKSTSLRNFEPGEVGVFSCAGKRLPFRKKLQVANTSDYKLIETTLKSGVRRAYVIDDSTYLMQFEMFDHAKEKGYGKFTDIAYNFEKLLEAARNAPTDTITYFLHHPSFDEAGGAKPQTVGKMLDNQLNIEGLFPIVIECRVEDGKHVFVTTNDGSNIAKSPVDVATGERMLPEKMDNDLKAVDTAIRKFWDMPPLTDKGSDGDR
jgi:hypothetical protein